MTVALRAGPLLADIGSRPPGQAPFIRLPDSMHCSMLPQASAPPLSVLTFPGSSTCLLPTSKYQPRLPTLRSTSSISLSCPHTPSPAHYVTTRTCSLDREMERDDIINSQPEYEYEHACISFLFFFTPLPTPHNSTPNLTAHPRFSKTPTRPAPRTSHLVPGPGPPGSCTLPLAVRHLFR